MRSKAKAKPWAGLQGHRGRLLGWKTHRCGEIQIFGSSMLVTGGGGRGEGEKKRLEKHNPNIPHTQKIKSTIGHCHSPAREHERQRARYKYYGQRGMSRQSPHGTTHKEKKKAVHSKVHAMSAYTIPCGSGVPAACQLGVRLRLSIRGHAESSAESATEAAPRSAHLATN